MFIAWETFPISTSRPKVSENFSWLLDKPASSSRYVALSLEDTLSWRCACVEKYSHNRFRFGPWWLFSIILRMLIVFWKISSVSWFPAWQQQLIRRQRPLFRQLLSCSRRSRRPWYLISLVQLILRLSMHNYPHLRRPPCSPRTLFAAPWPGWRRILSCPCWRTSLHLRVRSGRPHLLPPRGHRRSSLSSSSSSY